MTRLEDRQTLMRDIAQACAEGARLAPACALAGIAARTLQRWKIDGLTRGDRRPDAARPVPSHALSEAERARIIEVANEPRFAATPPARITVGPPCDALRLVLRTQSRSEMGRALFGVHGCFAARRCSAKNARSKSRHSASRTPAVISHR